MFVWGHGLGARSVMRLLAVLAVVTACAHEPSYGQEAPRGSPPRPTDERKTPIKIGVLAKRGLDKCLEEWGPTAEYLTSQVPGYSFTIVPFGFEEVDQAVARGDVDFVLANPSFYVGLERLHGAGRIATLKNRCATGVCTVVGGVIFCRADREDIQCLADLKGKTFMAVKETSFGGWQAAWRELKEHGIGPYRDLADLQFGGTHDAVVYAVRDGKVDSGTVRTDTLERMAQEGKIGLDDFRVFAHDHTGKDACYFPFLHSTNVYPEWPFFKVKHTPDELAQAVALALLNMPPDSPAANAARCAGWTVPLNYQPVHECLRELRVGPYEDFGKVPAGDVVREYWPWLLSGLVAAILLVVVVVYTRKLNRKLIQAVSTEKTRAHQQAVVADFGRIALSDVLLDELFDKAVALISQTLGTKYAKVLEHLPDQHVLFLRAGVGWQEGWVGHKSVPDGAYSQGGYTLLQDKPVIAEDIHNETRFSPPSLLTEHKVVGGMTVAIPGPDRPFGVLGVHTDRMQRFSTDDAHFLEAVANVLSGAIQQREAEEALKRNEETIRAMVETSQDWIWSIDAQGLHTYCSPAIEAILGYKPNEMVGKSSLAFMHEDDRREIESRLPDWIAKKSGWSNLLLRWRHKDGGYRYLESNAMSILDADGELVGFQGVDRDVTERKQADEELRELLRRRQELEQIVNHSPAVAFLWQAEEGWPVEYASESLAQFGYTPADFYERRLTYADFVHPDDLDRVAAEVQQYSLEGKEDFTQEYRVITQSGETRWVDDRTWVRRTPDGKITHYQGVLLDITVRKEAAEELRHSEERRELALRGADLGTWDWNVQTGEVTFDQRWAEMLGYTLDEIRPHVRSWEELVHPADMPGVSEVLNAHLEGKTPGCETEHRLRHKSGRWVWILDKGRVIERDAAGKPLRACGTHFDITERKRAEEEVESAKSFLDTVVDMSPFAMWVSDREGTVIRTNRSLCETLNLTDESIIGKYNVLKDVNLEMQGIMPMVKAVFEKHHPARFSIPWKAAEAGGVDFEGARDLYIDVSMFPILNPEGELTNVVCQWVDITERERAEEALAQAHAAVAQEAQKLRSMIEGMDEGIVVADAEDIVTEVNPWLLDKVGLTSPDIVGKSLWEFHPDTEGTARLRAALGAFRNGESCEKFVVNRELLGMQLSLRVQPIFESGHYRGVILNAIDVTDLVKARQTAEIANKSKSEFLANMSHEIRTPMTAILGFTEALLDRGLSDSEKLSAVHTIRRNGEHLLQIINNILDISKIEAGKLEVERIRCSPVQVIADVKSLMQVRADIRNLSFSIEFIGSVPETIESDPMRLKQILVNLIGNAIKFTETGGVTLITRFVDDGTAPSMQFDVVDTGFGMTEAQVGKLFQAFTQADTSTTRKFGGTGLGLHISKQLAGMLGGTITVESELGRGSTFHVKVAAGLLDGVKMLDDPTTATIARPETATAAGPDADKLDCRLLLAEDGLDNQRLISHLLKKAGAEVSVVANGKLAAEAALTARDEGNSFDVILMDMQMPVMDGYEATGLLRQKGYTGPIIALTAHSMVGDREKCLDAGCDDYAAKPIDRKKLIEAIQQHVHAAAVS
ncbi:MAG: PAS domain S-box protein [Phycisphaerae bacterium]|nr:PAS domain S-box protein [Phycisphaerae bacterium]